MKHVAMMSMIACAFCVAIATGGMPLPSSREFTFDDRDSRLIPDSLKLRFGYDSGGAVGDTVLSFVVSCAENELFAYFGRPSVYQQGSVVFLEQFRLLVEDHGKQSVLIDRRDWVPYSKPILLGARWPDGTVRHDEVLVTLNGLLVRNRILALKLGGDETTRFRFEIEVPLERVCAVGNAEGGNAIVSGRATFEVTLRETDDGVELRAFPIDDQAEQADGASGRGQAL